MTSRTAGAVVATTSPAASRISFAVPPPLLARSRWIRVLGLGLAAICLLLPRPANGQEAATAPDRRPLEGFKALVVEPENFWGWDAVGPPRVRVRLPRRNGPRRAAARIDADAFDLGRVQLHYAPLGT